MSCNYSSKCLYFLEYQNYNVHYKQSLLEQVPIDKYLVPSIISLNSRTENALSLTIEEKIDWLNSHKFDKTIEATENDSYFLGKLISNINLKDSKSSSKETVETKSFETQKDDIENKGTEEQKEDENTIKEQEIDELKAECENLKVNLEEIQADVKKLVSELNHATITEQNETKALESYEEESKIKMKAYELLDNGEENIKKLEESIEAYVNKLVNLANQWEKHRLPLIKQYRDGREKHSSKAVSRQVLYLIFLLQIFIISLNHRK